MSSKLDAIRRRFERGERVKEIRDALELTQDGFADVLTRRLAHYGVAGVYNRSKVSKMESGERKLTVEEAVVLIELDPEDRPGVWLVFGGKPRRQTVRESNERPAKKPTTTTAARGGS